MDFSELHKHSDHNRTELEDSEVCGCFYCLRIFDPKEIVEWIDRSGAEMPNDTALCPHCDIDAVIGDVVAMPTYSLLESMHIRWFCRTTKLSGL